MEAKALLTALKKKLNLTTDRQLAKMIGIAQPTLIRWKRNGEKLDAKQISSIVRKAINRGKEDARKYSIKPIVEYYTINATQSIQGATWELLNMSGEREKQIKSVLCKSHGIYVFYNSQCNAIYVGKAKRRDLWGEMKSAFSRARDPQVLWRVEHPSIGGDFLPAFEKPRRIRKMKVHLHDIAHYFSAYSIQRDLIDNAEALLIRIFANDLTNEQMERIELK